ncbi:cell wall hydrolase [Clostridium paridis]|uniref:Cell wall hydrolase n=1 Tax=Clostridium paridis TaxID=2803863 RepID=A0A937FI46_9CLOT|nr:cell wall hydrolase [Clostridium paridis]MBL4933859.1 cell wall hydrolase [Clostridium paridis]
MKKLYLFSFFFLTFFFYLSEIRVCAMESITDTQSAIPIKKDILLGESRILAVNNNEAKDLYKEKEEVVEVFSYNSKTLYITKEDIDLMAMVVYAESKGEPLEGKIAVASVILNRVTNPKFPRTIEGVIKQKNAFSCVKGGTINVTPDKDSYTAVYEAIRGVDPTNDALFFYNPVISTSNWMKNIEKKKVKNIGNHVFFRI